jgi:hypothetical protein
MQSGGEESSREEATLEYATPGGPHLEGSTPIDREAKASLLLGLLFFIPVFPALGAIVLGVRARRRLLRTNGLGKGIAMAGIICGGISLIIAMLVMIGMFQYERSMERYTCQLHLHHIASASRVYADGNQGVLPPNATALASYVPPKFWTCDACAPPPPPASGTIATSYVLVTSQLPNLKTIGNRSNTIVAYEPLSNHGRRGFAVAYLDGVVVWKKPEDWAGVMQQIQAQSVGPASMPVGK